MKGSAIRHLATSWSGKIFAAAKFKSVVSIWDLETEQKRSEFSTILDFGGHRLAIDVEGKQCVAAAYNVHGIACYDTKTGGILWQREDLKRAQNIRILPSQFEVACGFEDGPLCILSLSDGKTLQKIRNCKKLWVSQFEPVRLADRAKIELQNFDGETIFKIERESFAVLSMAFGHGTVAASEAAGPLRCFETSSGRLCWRYLSPSGNHSVQIGYHSQLRQFLGIEWPYEKGGIKSLLLLCPETGEVKAKFPLDSSIVEAFCLAGTHLLSSDGWLIETATGRLTKQFEFSKREYPNRSN